MNRLVLSFCVFVLPFLMFFSLNAQPGPGQSVQQGLKIEDIKEITIEVDLHLFEIFTIGLFSTGMKFLYNE